MGCHFLNEIHVKNILLLLRLIIGNKKIKKYRFYLLLRPVRMYQTPLR